MIGTIYVLLTGLLCFIYITIFYLPVTYFLSERKRVEFSRQAIAIVGKGLVQSARMHLQIVYRDKNAIENLDPMEGIVYVCNHQSNLDIPAVDYALKGKVGFVAKKEMRHWPFYGIWMRKMKCVFLNRSNPREGLKDIKRAVEIVKDGYPTLIFPEGERSTDGKIHPFKKGSFKLALDTCGIIVPITIKGTYEIQKRGQFQIKRNQKVRIIIDLPIFVNKLENKALKDLDKVIHEIIVKNFEKEEII
jgi:1-acyl-sn-glycerol-3-phosphate acyltransferase